MELFRLERCCILIQNPKHCTKKVYILVYFMTELFRLERRCILRYARLRVRRRWRCCATAAARWMPRSMLRASWRMPGRRMPGKSYTWNADLLKGYGNEADFLGILQKSVPRESLTLPFEPFRFWLQIRGESFFDYEYLLEYEAEIGTARKGSVMDS